MTVENGLWPGLDKLKQERSEVPAITHVDYSARVQTVDGTRHGRYYDLIKKFEEKTACSVLAGSGAAPFIYTLS